MPSIRELLDAFRTDSDDFELLRQGILDALSQTPAQAPELLHAVIAAGSAGRLSAPQYAELSTLLGQRLPTADAEATAMATTVATASSTPTLPGDPAAVPTPATAAVPPAGNGEAPATLMDVGAVLKNRFVLEGLIGRGGMGKVFVARDRRKEEVRDRDPYIAVKILSENFKQHPEAFIALAREAKKAQQLAHPNIVTVFDFDRDEDNVFMTMEFLKGAPLNRVMKKAAPNGLEKDKALAIIEQMGEALAYAHKHRIVHSDFKPGNVFVTDSDVVKVLDFGIARAAKNPNQAQDATIFDAASLGALTPAYASIEMMEGADPDPRDDVYALACVAYELLQGSHPFDKTPALQAKLRQMAPEPIRSLNKRQWKAMLRGLAFDRAERTPSAEEFVAGLLDRRNGLPLGWMAAAVLVLSSIIGGGVYLLRPAPAPHPVPAPLTQTPPPAAVPEPPPEPEPPAVELSADEQAKVERLLLIGEAHMLVGRLVEPPGSSAYDAFTEVLDLDPRNAVARDGMHQIADQLYDLAVQRIDAGQLDQGLRVVEAGLTVEPRHAKLLELQRRHPR